MIYALLAAHFVGDFICQSDWMAINKSKRWDVLGFHVLVYLSVLLVPVLVVVGDTHGAARFLVINAAAHFAQDAITSRITSRLWFFRPAVPMCGGRGLAPMIHWEAAGGNRHWFMCAIGADQLLHYVTLFVTAGWWLSA